ncbi:hypothetical protein D3C72_2322720 [compost metagenome]
MGRSAPARATGASVRGASCARTGPARANADTAAATNLLIETPPETPSTPPLERRPREQHNLAVMRRRPAPNVNRRIGR